MFGVLGSYLAAIDQNEGVTLHQGSHERCEHSRLAIVLPVDTRNVIHTWSDPIVRPDNGELQVVLRAMRIDQTLNELLGTCVAPALGGDWASSST